ncbi:TPA: FAD-dependent oxidoreductase, partial [Streptococcus pneumoniae]|nr:FAD-dependent oxidoreductase [Streptococcus pneumoniae]
NALKGNHAVAKLNLTPAAIYTLPEVAAVGLTEEQAREKYDVAIGKFNFAANGRAIASDAAQGFVKVIADKKYGEILGVHIIGPAAAELINEASSIIEMEITVEEMLKTIHGHPTYSEVMYEAFADVLGMAILTGTKLQEIIEENGQLRIKVEGKDNIIASKALLSIGRMPDLEGIGEVEFELDRGCIKVNEYMETSVPGIYAPGDINGTKMLAHAAFRMGEVSA